MLDMGFIHDVKQRDRHAAARAPDAVLLGDDAARGAGARRPAAQEPRDRRGRRRRRPPPRRSTRRCSSSRRPTSAPCSSTSSATATMKRVLVFSRTKHGANRIAEHLVKAHIEAEAIHGNKSQNARERALAGFKSGRVRVLVATDIAARGIDVDDVTHVVNFDVPEVPETYVHRIGRTARAGASGIAMTFCDVRRAPRSAQRREADAAGDPGRRGPPVRVAQPGAVGVQRARRAQHPSRRGSHAARQSPRPQRSPPRWWRWRWRWRWWWRTSSRRSVVVATDHRAPMAHDTPEAAQRLRERRAERPCGHDGSCWHVA